MSTASVAAQSARPPPHVTDAACAFVLLISGAALAGWAFDITSLTTAIAGLPPMMPVTAVFLALGGLSLWLLAHTGNRVRRVAGLAGAVAGTTFGLLTLGELVLGWSFNIDRILLPMLPGGRPSPYSAVCFLLLGLALLLLDVQTKQGNRPAQVLALVAALTAGLALAGQIIQYAPFYRTSVGQGMATHTAVAVLLLAAGVVFARPGGLMTLLASADSAGVTARRLLPLPFFLTFILSWISLAAARAGIYGREVGTWLLSLSNITLFTLLIWLTASLLHRADRERRRTSQALRESEQRFRKVFEDSPLGMALLSLSHGFTRVNPGLCHMLGYSEDELRERTLTGLMHPDDASMLAPLECSRDGATPAFRGEHRFLTKTQATIIVDLTVSVIHEQETPLYALALFKDVTLRKLAEQALNERTAQLETANQELEAFSYSVSHDLRAPLRHIDGFAGLLIKHADGRLDDKSLRFARTMSQSAKEMGQLIDDLLVFSRMGRAEMRQIRINLEDLVREVVRNCETEAEGRDIKWKIGRLREVQADPSMLRLVLTNLISNAVKYTRPRATAEIEIASQDQDNHETVYLVRDNGVGFDMRYVDKLFGVFQRLHATDAFEGTGIGLANVRRIIQRHGGRTWAEGVEDAGATFYFSLPSIASTSNGEAGHARTEIHSAG